MGSSNLNRRLRCYYSKAYIKNANKNRSFICKALEKYDYSNFSLEILEYCEPDNAVTREQYYIDLRKPEYNILPKAGSRLGSKHSEESLAKIRSYKHRSEQLAKLRDNLG